jgi:hypothetical protein
MSSRKRGFVLNDTVSRSAFSSGNRTATGLPPRVTTRGSVPASRADSPRVFVAFSNSMVFTAQRSPSQFARCSVALRRLPGYERRFLLRPLDSIRANHLCAIPRARSDSAAWACGSWSRWLAHVEAACQPSREQTALDRLSARADVQQQTANIQFDRTISADVNRTATTVTRTENETLGPCRNCPGTEPRPRLEETL